MLPYFSTLIRRNEPCFPCAVLNKRVFLKYWLPVIVWMCVIFAASSDSHSSEHSSRIIGPLLSWLFPHMPEDTKHEILLGVRKCAHLTEYALFAMLLWRALRKPQPNDTRPWSWRLARNVVLLAACYATTDEIHQVFVATRTPAAHDVVIDTIGAAIGLLVIWSFGRWRKKW
jgi:VanZ family protein